MLTRRSNYCCQHSLTLVDEKEEEKRTIEETQRRIAKLTMEICRLLVATIHFNNPLLNGGRYRNGSLGPTIRTLLLNGDRHYNGSLLSYYMMHSKVF